MSKAVKSEVGAHASSARLVGELSLFGVAYYFAYHYGMAFSPATASPFWFPDSVLLCALLLTRPRVWWLFVLAQLPIRLFAPVAAGIPPWFLLTTFGIDSAKGLLTALALRRFLKNPLRIESLRELGWFGLFAVLLVPAASAFAGAAARASLGNDYWTAWQQWFLGDVMAHLVITPALLYWAVGSTRIARVLPQRAWIEGTLVAIGLILSAWLAFDTVSGAMGYLDPRLFAPVPFLFWAAIRFGMPGATGAVTVLTYFAVNSAIQGDGPFTGSSPAEAGRALQQFLLVRAPTLYVVAILVQRMTRVEQELRESEERFRNMADTAPVLIWTAGLDGRLTFFNNGWADFTGASVEELAASVWTDWVHPDERRSCAELYERSVQERADFAVECRLRSRGGGHRWVLCKGIPRFSDREVFQGFIGSCSDIDAQKENTLEMQTLRAELAHVTRVATMGELSGSMTHELRQPLGAILSNAEAAEMLLEASPQAIGEVREILADIRADDQRAGEILGKMRGLLEKREVVRQPVEVNGLVSEIFRLMAIESSERHVSMQLEVEPVLPYLIGDRVHLQQVLMNLILNGFDAMAAMPESSRRLAVCTRRGDNGTVRISVADSGPGVSAERMAHLFEPFWTTKQKGLGLGLSISRTIVEAHEGRIWAENRAGGGAMFWIELPSLEIERT